MKKRISKKKFNRKKGHSDTLKKTMLLSLLEHGKLETVLARAKILKTYADEELGYCIKLDPKLVQKVAARRYGSLRLAVAIVHCCKFIQKKKDSIDGGFFTIVRTGFRSGDNSVLAVLKMFDYDNYVKFLEAEEATKTKETRRRSKGKQKAKRRKTIQKGVAKLKGTKPELEKKGQDQAGRGSRKESFLSRISDRILGRKVVGPDKSKNRNASKARSGI
ncbi:MAG: L17 family ribosomal protein [Patescibacteria group bacterium]|nr:L17 family ribosomal protein [Patescibacteria group bacterium]